jgi:hypothetical protein
MIISSLTPNQQGQNILQVQLSIIFPDRFHAMATFVAITNFYNLDGIFLEVNLSDHALPLQQIDKLLLAKSKRIDKSATRKQKEIAERKRINQCLSQASSKLK